MVGRGVLGWQIHSETLITPYPNYEYTTFLQSSLGV
jgi:hypothetical protein